MRLRVCIPFYSEWSAAAIGCRELQGYDFVIEPRQGTYIYEIRNSFVDDMTGSILDFDAWLFVDSDVTFTLQNVLDIIARDLPIVAGASRTHKDRSVVQAGFFGVPGVVKSKVNTTEWGLKEVDFVGTDFCFIRREVFEKIDPDWFRHLPLTVDGVHKSIGEDYSFCILARQAGFKIYIDMDIRVDHRQRKQTSFDWKGVSMEFTKNYDSTALQLNSAILKMAADYAVLGAEVEKLQKENAKLKEGDKTLPDLVTP